MSQDDVNYFANHVAVILRTNGMTEADHFVDCILESYTYYGEDVDGKKQELLSIAERIVGGESYGINNTCRVC